MSAPASRLERVTVLGLGKVGLLAAELLHDGGFDVTGCDRRSIQHDHRSHDHRSHDHRSHDHRSHDHRFAIEGLDVTDVTTLRSRLASTDAVLSCLPYHLNGAVAEIAHELGVHYFDLTEDVTATRRIRELAATATSAMAPQCGLAPGFVGIVAASQVRRFDRCRSVRMRVGALPQHPTGLMGYAFNWSPVGVVNEYLNDCEVIEEGVHKWVSPMEWRETIYVAGTQLEAFTTSGGLGTMCETYLGVVDNLDYKTLRYPGHMRLMNFFFHELLMRERRELAGEILTNAKPPVDEDVVYVHVASEGLIDGQLRRLEYVRAFTPRDIAGARRTAIAWTTAASVASVIEMVRDALLPQQGFIKQEDIGFEQFAATPSGQLYTTA